MLIYITEVTEGVDFSDDDELLDFLSSSDDGNYLVVKGLPQEVLEDFWKRIGDEPYLSKYDIKDDGKVRVFFLNDQQKEVLARIIRELVPAAIIRNKVVPTHWGVDEDEGWDYDADDSLVLGSMTDDERQCFSVQAWRSIAGG